MRDGIIKASIEQELLKNNDEETTFQIRIFDDKTHGVTYKHLTRKELEKTLGLLDGLEWR